MDPGSVAATGGAFISLSENEQRCYSGLHALCQADSSGKLSASKVAELFRASQLPNDTLHQVTEVCGAKRLGFFASSQFYVALKLLAAAQTGLPVRLESISAELPLPMFVGIKNEVEDRYPNHSHSSETPPLSSATDSASRPTTDRPTLRHPDTSTDTQEPWSPAQSPCPSPPHSPPAYHSYPYAMSRNGTDSLLVYDGQQVQSVGQEQPSPYTLLHHPAPEPQALTQAVSVETLVEKVEGEYLDDPWRITVEQQDYYTHQFRSLQPDLSGLILGTAAKNFFTKSKLPIPELSHIWELSDEDRDGALSFPEFCTAFHLVVARKNGYRLPDRLPPTLGAVCREHSLLQNAQPLILFEDSATPRKEAVVSQQETREGILKQAEFSPKRTAAAQDQPFLQTSTLKPDLPQELDLNVKSRTRPRSYSSTSIDDAMKKGEEPPTPPPRPQKTHSRASSLDLNQLLQQGSQGGKSLAHPPALPPRPAAQMIHFLPDKNSQQAMQQHYFADFSKLREEEEGGVIPEGVASSRPEDSSASKTDSTVLSQNQVPQKPVRRKLHPECQNATPPLGVAYSSLTPATLAKPTLRLAAKQKREIQTTIRKNRETNAVLTRLNSELQQQLKEVHQQRVALESQLELLRPVAST